MEYDKELQDAFRNLGKRDVDTFPADVVSVDKIKGTCNVTDDNLTFTNVRLSSVIDRNNKKFFLFPKVGSSVLVSPINEDLKNLYVEEYSEIESLELVISTVEFKVDQDGFLLKKENETLKKLIEDLITAVQNMSFAVSTPSGSGTTTTLINLAEFTAVKTRFNQFLKGN
ncbi:hypothetical protein FIA58_013795 [Flavobacterium jejuense]|uniref:Uncharacterized protein n=1 Tax=Flavobacterium jejuense TaxID=1544455 RepID=A0ABX0ISS3_9FLAO|nr:hypothetical protein [Flavobacterium jejuense]NHN26753.1 hypothetical protein [Flavobacterium jejuense]